MIAYRHRVKLADLVTDKTKERIAVWIYLGEKIIAEITIKKIHHRDTEVTEPNL